MHADLSLFQIHDTMVSRFIFCISELYIIHMDIPHIHCRKDILNTFVKCLTRLIPNGVIKRVVFTYQMQRWFFEKYGTYIELLFGQSIQQTEISNSQLFDLYVITIVWSLLGLYHPAVYSRIGNKLGI